MCSPAFPILGTTPAFASQARCERVSTEVVGSTCSVPQLPHLKDCDRKQGDGWASPSKSDGSPVVSGREGQPSCDSDSGSQAKLLPTESVTSEENQLCGNMHVESWKQSTEQVRSTSMVRFFYDGMKDLSEYGQHDFLTHWLLSV